MDEILRKQKERRMKTPAHLVPPAAMGGEHTYGFFPSARDIRKSERRKDLKSEKASINKIWNLYPTISPRDSHTDQTSRSFDSCNKHVVLSPQTSVSQSSMTGIEKPDKYEVVNLGAYFGKTDDRRQKHFFISPEWISEGITVKRIDKGKQQNPLHYGWI